MKSCNIFGVCNYKIYGGVNMGCNYEGYCDFQAPRDSGNTVYKECLCRQTTVCPICSTKMGSSKVE